MEGLVQIEGLSKTYGNNRVIEHCSLQIQKNRIIGVVGENGVGKSTLLKIIAGLCEPNDGTLFRGNAEC